MKYQSKSNEKKNKKHTPSLHWSIPEKKQNRVGVEDMEFSGMSLSEWNFQE